MEKLASTFRTITGTQTQDYTASSDIGPEKPFRTITVNFTNYLITDKCTTCGKEKSILAGLPKSVTVRVKMTDEEFEAAHEKQFFTAVDFEITCNNGFSHVVQAVAKGSGNPYVVSDTPGLRQGYWEEGPSFEIALSKFIPRFAEMVKDAPRTTRLVDGPW